MQLRIVAFIVGALASVAAQSAMAQIRITEWMYDAKAPELEYVELTNVGSSPIDMTGWSYDDSHEVAGTLSLSAFGTVAADQSVIIAEAAAADFRTVWGLSDSVEVIGDVGHPTGNNLGRSDEINIYDNTNALVDRLTYNDQGTGNVKGPRTQNVSGNPSSPAALGANNASLWVLSSNGDSFGSYDSTAGNTGNPGIYAVPEPATALLMALGGCFMLNTLRLRRK